MGVPIQDGEVAVRRNLISLDGDRIKNHSQRPHHDGRGARAHRRCGPPTRRQPRRASRRASTPAISYRHLTVLPGGWAGPGSPNGAPPHDNVGGLVADLLPAARAGAAPAAPPLRPGCAS